MSDVSFLEPVLVAGSTSALFAKPRCVCDPRDRALLANVSSRIMRDPAAKAFPDVMSFAFWCRKAHLDTISELRADLRFNLGRGLALHITPSNVPVNFAFSWAFSLLAGNANVVRVPSKSFRQVSMICNAVNSAMLELGDERSAFVSYPSSLDITERLSAIADVRTIWGGDATVSSIHELPSRPRCIDIAFADRFSIACIDATAINGLDRSRIARLATDFYNDTYLMDQNACSSPMTIVWLNKCDSGRNRFWKAVRSYAIEQYTLQEAIATEKYIQLCRDALEGRITGSIDFDGYLDVITLDIGTIGNKGLSRFRGKGGYFYEIAAEKIEDVLPLLDRTCQTITYFGIDADQLRLSVIDSGSAGIDRIVPIGKAMDIDIVWDGMDLLSMMSRYVDLR